MNNTIAKMLHSDEFIEAKVTGRLEQARDGSQLPIQGILIATNLRLLFFVKEYQVPTRFVCQINYDNVTERKIKEKVFDDLLGEWTQGYTCKDTSGRCISLLGAQNGYDFEDYMRTRLVDYKKGTQVNELVYHRTVAQ